MNNPADNDKQALLNKSEVTSLETIGNIDDEIDDINSAISPKSSPQRSPAGIMWPSQSYAPDRS